MLPTQAPMNPSMSKLYIKWNLYCSYMFSISPTYIWLQQGIIIQTPTREIQQWKCWVTFVLRVTTMTPWPGGTEVMVVTVDEVYTLKSSSLLAHCKMNIDVFLILIPHRRLVSCVKVSCSICFNIRAYLFFWVRRSHIQLSLKILISSSSLPPNVIGPLGRNYPQSFEINQALCLFR